MLANKPLQHTNLKLPTNFGLLDAKLILGRAILCGSIALIEFIILYHFKDGVGIESEQTIREYLRNFGGIQFFLATHVTAVIFCTPWIYLFIIFTITIQQRKSIIFLDLIRNHKIPTAAIKINILAFTSLLAIFIFITNPKFLVENPLSVKALIYAFSPLLWALYLYSFLDYFFPLTLVKNWVIHNFLLVLGIILVTIVFTNSMIIELVVNFFSAILLQPTLDLALVFANLFGFGAHTLSIGPMGPVFGTERFQVEIWPACSGYEGLALIAILLTAFCYLQRNILRFPSALVIFPFAGILMFILNAVRIVVLIAIGHFFSPELALNGFHVVGGWLNLLVVLMCCLLILNSTSYFLKEPNVGRTRLGGWEGLQFLLPIMVLILGGLVTKIFEADFTWLYPIPIGMVFLILLYFYKYLKFILVTPSISSYIIGIVVFIFWIYLVPIDQNQNQIFIDKIQAVPMALALSWIVFRIIGASFIVPVAEELAFRGFMLERMNVWFDTNFIKDSFFPLSLQHIRRLSVILSLFITSFLFGILHSNILAGSVAGLFYGMAYLIRRKLIDSVVAHSVTNGLLVLDVVYFGNWSYW